MARYIDKDKLISEIEDITWYHIGSHGELIEGANGDTDTPLYKADDIYKVIGTAPDVDVRKVKHGERYLLNNCANEGVYCSVCHKKVYRLGYANVKPRPKFCPNCGADMRR